MPHATLIKKYICWWIWCLWYDVQRPILTITQRVNKWSILLDIEIHPNHWYKESNTNNNVFTMPLQIAKQQF
jgi:hypothetical protein